jgi:hypothetical protein
MMRENEVDALTELQGSSDMRETMQNYLEKRQPGYSGN